MIAEEDMLLLDKRTQSLVENYVPEGEILEGIVDFFSVFADSTRVRILSALAHYGNVRDGYIARARNQSDHRVAPAAPAQKYRDRQVQPLRKSYLLQSEKRNRQRRSAQGRGIFRVLKRGGRQSCPFFIAKSVPLLYNKTGRTGRIQYSI